MTLLGSEALAAVATNALEETAFLFVSEVPDAALPPAGRVVASIAFATPARGRLRVSTDRAGAQLLAANVLGVDADDPDVVAQSAAAVGELANILAGLVVAEVAAPSARTEIDIPRIGDDEPTAPPVACAVSLRTDEGFPFRFELSWEDDDDSRSRAAR